MAPPQFASTLRAVAADRAGSGFAVAVGLALLAAWLAWAATAELPLTAASERACLAAALAPQVVSAPADGTLVRLDGRLGEVVARGQVLAVVASPALVAAYDGARGRRASLVRQLAALGEQAAAHRTALAADADASAAQARQLAAEGRRAALAAERAAKERDRRARLLAAGVVSAADAERSRLEAEELAAGADAAGLAREVRAGDRAAAALDRQALLADPAREAARLQGELAAADADLRRLSAELAALTVRAPCAGRLGAPPPLLPGAAVRRGEALALVAPQAAAQAVAEFAGTDRPLLRVGQPARVTVTVGAVGRLVLPGVVAGVAPLVRRPVAGPTGAETSSAEPDGVLVAVLLLPRAGAAPSLELAGAPCRVEVEVARLTPAALVWRALRPRTVPTEGWRP
jgi:multidrug resistance efflux pump